MNGPDLRKAPASREELARLAEIILEIQKGSKALDYYPDGHPALSEALNNCYRTVDERLKGLDSLSISVKRRGFFSGFHQIGKGIKPLTGLARDLYIKGARKIFILKGLTPGDFDNFLRTIHMSPKELKECGGIEDLLIERGVRTVWLNEINYDRVIGKDLSYRGETEEVVSREPEEDESRKTKPAPFAIEEEEEKKLAEETEEERKETTLAKLLDEIKGEVDSRRYYEIVSLMIPLAVAEVSGGRFDLPVEILNTLSYQIDSASQKSADRERAALKGIRGIATPPLIDHLIVRLCDRMEDMDISSILLKIGEHAVDPLLDALAETGDMHCRRVFTAVIERFGRSAIERVKERMGDPRWFVARNMVSILGDIGSREDIPVLEGLLGHGDTRVGKEAVKAISRVGGREAATVLVKKFEKAEKELRRIILFSLGILEEPAALPLLLKVSHRKGLIAGDQDTRKEAILALGKLGREEGVAALEEILAAEHMFRKEPQDLRLASAQSLAAIGGKKAAEALKKGLSTGSDEIRRACERFLKAVGGEAL